MCAVWYSAACLIHYTDVLQGIRGTPHNLTRVFPFIPLVTESFQPLIISTLLFKTHILFNGQQCVATATACDVILMPVES